MIVIGSGKNRRIQTENAGRNAVIFSSLLLMLIAVPVSRGALSASMMFFLAAALVHRNFWPQVKAWAGNPLLLSFSFLFFIPAVSGFWSADTVKWADVVRIKLPLLLFPVAFAGGWQLSKKQWLIVAIGFITLAFGGSLWGLLHYLQNMEAVHAGYLKAKSIPTPFENDHVRFSWMVTAAFIMGTLLMETTTNRRAKILLGLLLLFFAVYLHVLSARTGLLSLYFFLFLYGVCFLRRQTFKKAGLLVVAVCLLPFVAYLTLPTLQGRVRYILYDASFIQQGAYLPGSNDGARTMSLKAGWQVLKQNPWGAGAGDVMHEADKWYQANVPGVLATDKFYPSSEWLLYGCFWGWPGVVAFTAIMLFPFFIRVKQYKIFWLSFQATAAFSFAFDMGLEVQYGIFIYAFSFFCWWKWLHQGEPAVTEK